MRYLILILIFVGGSLHCQKYYDDAQVRGHFSLEKKINKWSFQIDQQYRFTNNAQDLTRISLNPGVGYKITKNIRVQADYVFIQKKDEEEVYSNRHWYGLAGVFKYDHKRWKFQYRNYTQLRYGKAHSKWADIPRVYNRNKVSVKYEATKRFTPYLAAELYLPLNSPQLFGIERARGFGGLLFNTFRNQQLEFYFLYQQQIHKNFWFKDSDTYDNMLLRRHFIYGIGYSIVF